MMGQGSPSDAVLAISAILHAEGRTATAFSALNRGMQVDVSDATARPATSPTDVAADAYVAYVRVPGGVVTAGEPVAPLDRLVDVAESFMVRRRATDGRVAFFATEGRLLRSHQLDRWLIGEQPIWNPQEWEAHLRGHRSLREQLRRARAKGVVVRALTPEAGLSAAWHDTFDRLIRRWHATRSMPPMRFLVDVDLRTGARWRRTFVALRGDHLVGLLSMAPVPARRGWLLEHLLRDPEAPNGTAELLVDQAMREMQTEGVSWATLGLAPLHGPIAPWLAKIRRASRPLFNFDGLAAFKRKLRPDGWEPIYLAWPRENVRWLALYDGLRAFAGGPLWWFGVRTIARGPAPLLRLLEWLLVPWTVLLALVPTTPWFPSPVVHAAWVFFDVLLVIALWRLRYLAAQRGAVVRRRAAQLGGVLALAVSGDALLTISQAVIWNWPQRTGVLASLVVGLACLAPALTAPVLWGAWRRLQILATRPATFPA
ncbi:hypothetical membrane protein [Gemmatimonas aurantiaca T-27]|nr:DUF2156 domain-containing protein [Gemmatimonas aurantiaca]BAH40969.1 hypothetical membrane protein [Gemmatimonas aurantiaca T-27]